MPIIGGGIQDAADTLPDRKFLDNPQAQAKDIDQPATGIIDTPLAPEEKAPEEMTASGATPIAQKSPSEETPTKTNTPMDFLRPDQIVRLREKAMRELRNQTGDPPAKVSAMNTRALFDKILNGQMGDRSEIDKAYLAPLKDPNAGISKADHDWLVKEFEDGKTADGRSLHQREADMFKAAEHLIKNPLDMSYMTGPDDRQAKLDVFRYDVQKKIDEYRKAGKNPLDLFDPIGHPDEYLAQPKFTNQYQRSLQDVLHDQNRLKPPPPAPAAMGVQPRIPGEDIATWKKRTGYGAPKVGDGLTPEVPLSQ